MNDRSDRQGNDGQKTSHDAGKSVSAASLLPPLRPGAAIGAPPGGPRYEVSILRKDAEK